MATLFDTLKQTLAQPPAAAQPQQASVQKVLKAKSGKAGASGGPGASNLGESQALAQGAAMGTAQAQEGKALAIDLAGKSADLDSKVQTANADLASKGRMAASDLATQGTNVRTRIDTREDLAGDTRRANEELKVVQINNAAEMKLKELAADRRVTTADLFQSFEHSNRELEFRKDAAELEQLGFMMAMRDKSYVDELNRIGEMRNLNDEIAFREETVRLTFGNQLTDLLSKLNFQSVYNSDERAFEKQLAGIDASFAASLAESAIRDANNQAMVQGAIDATKGGVDAWAKYGKDTPSSAPSEERRGVDATGGLDGPAGGSPGYRSRP